MLNIMLYGGLTDFLLLLLPCYLQKGVFSLFLHVFYMQLRAILGEAICSYHARIGRDPKLQASADTVLLSLTLISYSLCIV